MTMHATFRRAQYALSGTLEARDDGKRCGGPWECRAGASRPINAIKISPETTAEIAALTAIFGPSTGTFITEE